MLNWGSLLSGSLCSLSFAPFGIWPLALAAYAFLFHAIYSAKLIRQKLFRGLLFGLGKFSVGTVWLLDALISHAGSTRLTAVFVFLLLIVLLAVLFCLACGFALQLKSKIAASLLLAGTMCTHEILISFPIGFSFPLLHIGYAFVDTPISTYAPIGGVWLVGYVALFSATSICFAFYKSFAPILIAACLWLASLPLGIINWTREGTEIDVVLVQANTSTSEQMDNNEVQEIWNDHVQLTITDSSADLYVWPESSIPITVDALQSNLDEISTKLQGSLVIGTFEQERSGSVVKTYNVATVAGPELVNYRKQQLVPFGEYTPRLWLLTPLLERVDYPTAHVSSGSTSDGLLPTSHAIAKVTICYEIAYPLLVNKHIQNSDLVIALNADAWFGESIGPWQQLQIAQMRARETGRFLLRVSNVGPTAIVAPNGTVRTTLPTNTPDALNGRVHIRKGSTMFSKLGLLPIGSILLFSFLVPLAILNLTQRSTSSGQ